MRTFRIVVAALGAFAALSAPVRAQEAEAAGAVHPWAAFFGCWLPVDGTRSVSVTCIVPGESSPLEAQQISLVGQAVVRTVSLHADGTPRQIDDAGCRGFDVAAFSDDATRVYTRGSANCSNYPEQITTGVLSITPDGQFLQVVAVRVGDQRTVTTQRFGLLRVEDVPTTMQARVAPLARMASGARTMAAQPVRMPAVDEMLQSTDAAVVEAWMAETGTGLEVLRLTRRDLERMADADVPTRIIDLAVVLANPGHFEPRVERVASSGGGGGFASMSDPFLTSFCNPLQFGGGVWSSSFPGWAPIMYPGVGVSYYAWLPGCLSRAGFFGSRFSNGYGFYGNWWGGPFAGGPVPVVVTTNPVVSRGPGTVTKGNGYTRGSESGTGGGTATPRSGTGTVTAAPASGSGAGASAGVRSAGSGGTGRTAKPRDPDPDK